MMVRRIALGLGLLSCAAALIAVGRASADRGDPAIETAGLRRELSKALSDSDWQRRLAAYDSALKHHDANAKSLLALARRPREADALPVREDAPRQAEYLGTRDLAIKLLARYGTCEAIPACVESVEYWAGGMFASYSPLNGYPCAQALVDFGLSSQPAIFAFLQETPVVEVSDKAIKLYADVMLHLYQTTWRGHEEAVEVVRRAIDRTPNDRRQNMQRLLEKLEEITEGWSEGSPPTHPTE